MRLKWKTPRNKDAAANSLRRLDFHSTSDLIARRQRLRKRVGASLAILVGLGLVLFELGSS